jgi:hypothetical protein
MKLIFLFLILLIPFKSFGEAETADVPNRFDVRTAPLSLLYTSWYNIETAYRLCEKVDVGVNYTRYGRDVDSGGNMFFPTFEGDSYGVNANYYFLKPTADKTFYAGAKLNYEDFESVGHSSPTVLRYKGLRTTLVGGIRANLFEAKRFHLLLGGGASAVFFKTEERTIRTTPVTNSYRTNSVIPYVEFKVGYRF